MWVPTTLVVLSASFALGVDYCSINTLPNESSYMHFTKEPVPLEYGYQDKFKSIHCCVRGYRSIEWFKNGVAYPWSAGVSSLILDPEAANQTLYSRRATRADSGNYTCRLSNETHSISHTAKLDILQKPTDAPKIMYISSDQFLEEGSTLRLYCEALIGRSYLADARSDLRWLRVWPNTTEVDLLPSQIEIKTVRKDVEEITGSYLTVRRMTAGDYGRYACVVHSNDIVSKNYVNVFYKSVWTESEKEKWHAGGEVPWQWLVIGGALLFTVLLSCVVFHRRCTPRLLLAARHAHARTNTAQHRARVFEKEFDVLVCWTAVDGELVRGALLPTLQLRYHYRVHTLALHTQPDTWYKEIMCEEARSRSIVVVVSPTQYSPHQLLLAFRQLRALPKPPVVVLLQDLPKLKREAKESGERLVSVLRNTKLVPWRHVHEKEFWTTLRLALPLPPPPPPPPPPSAHKQQNKPVSPESDNKNCRSSSLTALV